MQLYKVVTPFEFENQARKLGEEIVCSAREGEELIKKKLVVPADKELDPKNPTHAKLLDAAKERKATKHAGLKAAEDEKDAAKDDREAEKDTVLTEKRAEAVALAISLGRDDIAAIEAMGEAELEKEIAVMKGAEVANATEETKKEAKKERATKTK